MAAKSKKHSELKKPASPRSKGRPPQNGSQVGREAVIAAARQVLKRLPPMRLSRIDVAKEAGIDPGLVRYYFGNKSSLLTEVILTIAKELQERRGVAEEDVSLVERLRRRLRALIEILSENPYLHYLLLQRVIYGEAAGLDDIAHIRNAIFFSSLGSLRALIDEGVANRLFRPIKIELFYIAVIGLCEFPVNAFPVFELLEGKQTDAAATYSRYVDFITDLLLHGLEAK